MTMTTNTNIGIRLTLSLTLSVVALGLGCDIGDKNLGETTSDQSDGETHEDDACDDLISNEALPDTFKTVRVTNSTAAPIWLPGHDCLTFTRFNLLIDGAAAVDVPDEGTSCDHILITDHCSLLGCEGDTLTGGVIRIGPGDSYDLEWRAYAHPWIEIEGVCRPSDFCDAPVLCTGGGKQVAAGSQVTMSLLARSSCEREGGECTCDSGETCEMPQAEFAFFEESLTAETSFELVLDASIIELEFTP